MTEKGILKNFFAGGNTAYGFYSLYNNIISAESGNKLIILKGGPGTGKSSLIKHLGEIAQNKGLEVEFFYCSADSKSLDGIHIPALKSAVVDGTAPHVIDPQLPGCFDRIENLGECWQEESLRKNRDKIFQISKEIKGYYETAYSYLAQNLLIQDQLARLSNKYLLPKEYSHASTKLLNRMFKEINPSPATFESRELFAGAISPEGLVNFYNNIFSQCRRLFFLDGGNSNLKSNYLERAYWTAQEMNLKTEVYRCSFNPKNIDAIVFPENNTAIAKSCYPHIFTLDSTQTFDEFSLINFDDYYGKIAGNDCNEKEELEKAFWGNMGKAISFIKRANTAHSNRETHYILAMDFEKIDLITKKIVKEIGLG